MGSAGYPSKRSTPKSTSSNPVSFQPRVTSKTKVHNHPSKQAKAKKKGK